MFFKWQFPFWHKLQLFEDSFIFAEGTSSHFLRVTILTNQLLSLRSYFFRAAAFLRSSLFRTVTFSQQLFFQKRYFFQSEISTEQSLIENRKFFRTVTFRNSYLFGRGIVTFWWSYFFRASTFFKAVIDLRKSSFLEDTVF